MNFRQRRGSGGIRLADALHNDRGGQFDALVIDHLHQAGRIAIVNQRAILHIRHLLGMDGKHILHAVLYQQDGDAVIGQAAEELQRFVGRSRVQAGQRLVQQQDARAHGQHGGQGHLLLLAAGELEGLPVAQVADLQIAEGLIDALEDFSPGQAQVFQSKGDFVEHVAGHDLALGVLQQGADDLRELGHAHLAHRFAKNADFAFAKTMVGARDQPVDAAHEGGFAAAAGAGQKHHLPGQDAQVDVLERLLLAAGVFKG